MSVHSFAAHPASAAGSTNSLLVRAAVIAVLLAGVVQARGEDAGQPAAADESRQLLALDSDTERSSATQIESVTVTARRREENAQDVPIPIAALSGDDLENSGQFRLEDLNQRLPSTNVQFGNPRQSSIAVRGLGNNPANDALESSVGVYLDDVYLGRPGMANLDLIDIDQIALLRGPQGTLFGKNTAAGVLNITTRQPTFAPEGRVETTFGRYGNDSEYQVRGTYSGPLSDTLAGRLSVAKTYKDGYVNDVTDGRQFNGSDRLGFRSQLLYTPSDTFSLRVIGDYEEENSRCCASVLYSPGPNNGSLFLSKVAAAGGNVVYDPDYQTVTLNNPQYMQVRQGGGSVEANWKLGDYKLTSISAYRSWWFLPTNDADSISVSAITNAGQAVDDEQWSQELRIASPDGQPVEWVTGLYYFYQYQNNQLFTRYGPAAAAYLGSPILTNGYTDTRAYLNNDSYALFSQATWHITNAWSLTAGLRDTLEDKSARIIRDTPEGSAGFDKAYPYDNLGRLTTRDNNVSGLLSLGYKFTDGILGYASVARGAVAGGINPSIPVPGLTTQSLFIEPETATDAELGVKSTLLDQRLSLNVNLFWTRVKDYQATQLEQTTPGVYQQTLSNIGLVRTEGVETEISAVPVKGLTLGVTASYNDAIYLSYRNAPCSAEAQAAGQTVCDLTGRPVVGAPRWIVNPNASYTQALSDRLTGYISSDYAWRSDFFGSPDDSDLAKINAYGLLNARCGVTGQLGARNTWDASLWATNALDKHYVVGGLGIGTYRSYFEFPGEPRVVGVTFRLNF